VRAALRLAAANAAFWASGGLRSAAWFLERLVLRRARSHGEFEDLGRKRLP
jgi:hypothetical protein